MADENASPMVKQKENLAQRFAFSIKQAAELTGLSEDTIRRAINSGNLCSFRPGRGKLGKIMIRREAIDDWIKRLEGRD